MKKKLIEKFPEVLSEKLMGAHMNIPKVCVDIKPDSQAPKKTYTCCEHPIHWRPHAQKLIQEPPEQKIITEVKEA